MLNYTQRYAPRVRVEVYFPLSDDPIYEIHRRWVIQELTQLHGGCSVHEDLAGYFRSENNKSIKDRISVIYSDFEMDWFEQNQQTEVLDYCATLRQFLLDNLSEEEILITAYPVSHVM